MSGDWRERAACRGTDLTVFFPEGSGRNASVDPEAARLCARCPVRRDCLEAELAKGLPQFGWFGGKSADDRAEIIRKRKRRRAAA